MSGPNPPGREPEEPDSANEIGHDPEFAGEPADELQPRGELDSHDALEPLDDSADIAAGDQTGQTDAYSRAYSAPESEHFITGPYVPADLRLYEYDGYDESTDSDDEHRAPRWPWVVGIAAIVAAIALVVSVSLLVAGTDTSKLANPGTTTVPSTPPMQDEITTTKPPPPPSTATAHHRAPTSHGDPDGDGDASAATTAAAGPGCAAAGDEHRGGAPAAAHHAGRSQAGHVFGDWHQSAGRHHLGDLRRRVWSAAHAAQRVHPVVDDGHADLAIRRGFGRGVQPFPGQQTQLLDHDERRNGACRRTATTPRRRAADGQ